MCGAAATAQSRFSGLADQVNTPLCLEISCCFCLLFFLAVPPRHVEVRGQGQATATASCPGWAGDRTCIPGLLKYHQCHQQEQKPQREFPPFFFFFFRATLADGRHLSLGHLSGRDAVRKRPLPLREPSSHVLGPLRPAATAPDRAH